MIDDEVFQICERILESPRDSFLDLIAIAGLDIKKDLTDSDFSGMDMIKQNLQDANFKRSILRHVSFLGANLLRANFDHADLQNAIFSDAYLTSANFTGADLTNANFTNSNLDYAIFSGSVLDNTNFTNSRFFDVPVNQKIHKYFPILLQLMYEYPKFLRKSIVALNNSDDLLLSFFEISREFKRKYATSSRLDEAENFIEAKNIESSVRHNDFNVRAGVQLEPAIFRMCRLDYPPQRQLPQRGLVFGARQRYENQKVRYSKQNARMKVSRIPGVTEEYSDLLGEAGVVNIYTLSQSDPKKIHEKVILINKEKKLVRRLPSLSKITSWVDQARVMVRQKRKHR